MTPSASAEVPVAIGFGVPYRYRPIRAAQALRDDVAPPAVRGIADHRVSQFTDTGQAFGLDDGGSDLASHKLLSGWLNRPSVVLM
jgi:hypothetical protein